MTHAHTDPSVAAAERVADAASPMWGEHRSRYQFALDRLPAEALVLDVACGAGLGADILLRRARRVVGIDIDMDALRIAAGRAPAGFAACRGDATRLPLRSGSVDAVTSFETIEHITDAETYLDEIARVLKPEGVLVLSTPNALFTQPVDGVPTNPFHVREYLAQELAELLATRFGEVALFGQRTSGAYGSCPYWERGSISHTGARARLQSMMWRALIRMPPAVAERLSRSLLRRELHPGETDFEFTADPEAGHVFLAVCMR